MRLIIKSIFVALIAVFVLVITMLMTGLLTTPGSSLIAKKAMAQWDEYADVKVGDITGNMVQGLWFSNLTLSNLRHCPEGTVFQAERLFINLASLQVEGLTIEIENARLKLPSSGSILLFGKMKNGNLDFNVYANNADANEVLSLFPKKPQSFKHVEGFLSNVDLFVQGNYRKPELSGSFYVDKVFYKDFVLANSPGHGNVTIEPGTGDRSFDLRGPVFFKKGDVLARKIQAHMEDSKVIFKGVPKNPDLNLYGYSVIDDLKINIRIEGTRERPEMELSSLAFLSQTQLLLMLVTGKGWAGLDGTLAEGTIAPDLAKDAIDYFVFGGTGGKIADQLGITDISINLDQGKRGIAVKKGFTKLIEVGYGIEQSESLDQTESTVTQTLGGEIKMTDKISVGVERELKRHYDPTLSSPTPLRSESDDKLMLKYKRRF